MPELSPFALDVDEIVVRGEQCGTGPPLILVHGWTLDRRIFRFQIDDFSKHFRVIFYDRRGCGESAAKPDLAGDITDLVAIIDRVAGEPAHLLGMSQGGRIALRCAALHQEKLRSMVLQGPALDQFAASARESEAVPVDAFSALVAQGRLAELRERWLKHVMMTAGVTSSDSRKLLKETVAAYDGADLLQQQAVDADFTLTMDRVLPRVEVPTLLLTGGLETAERRAHSSRIRELLPNCKEVILSKSGHMSNLGEIDRYNASVIEFCLSH